MAYDSLLMILFASTKELKLFLITDGNHGFVFWSPWTQSENPVWEVAPHVMNATLREDDHEHN